MATQTDNWIRNSYISTHTDIIIEVDNVIKLKNPLGEAFWVIVSEILPNDKFVGKVNNHLVMNSPYNYDDEILFAKEDIREHKNALIQQKQLEMVKIVIELLKDQIGRMPTLEEVDLFLTNFTPVE